MLENRRNRFMILFQLATSKTIGVVSTRILSTKPTLLAYLPLDATPVSWVSIVIKNGNAADYHSRPTLNQRN
jgi:hypothetical protein